MESNIVKVIQTAENAEEFWNELDELSMEEKYDYRCNSIYVNTQKIYQTIMGFGGAFTEASAYTWSEADAEQQEEIIEAYFDKEKGLGYNIGRTSIGGCDFSLEPYTYIDEGDGELESFDMSREEKWVVPFLKAAENKAGQKIELLCSPWSPPAFMKDNNDINHGGKLLKDFYHSWAKYMVKYIVGMKNKGFDISMVSIQNEPEAVQRWASCIYDATEEAEFAVDYLYPELKAVGLEDEVKIVVWDHNRDMIFRRMNETMSYPGAKDVIWGTGYHWYITEKAENLAMVHEKYPDKHILFTEGCVELTIYTGSTSSKSHIGSWKHGETYGRNIINDFNNYNEARIDWNLLLNEEGGPNYVNNFCEAPIIYDRNEKRIKYSISYYYTGHFSRYIKPQAKRIACFNDAEEKLYSTAFENPDGEVVVVVQNEADSEQKLALIIDEKGTNTVLPPHSITTFVMKND